MCGRFALHNFYLNRVANEYPDIPPRRWEDEEDFHPRYNVAPQTRVLAILQQPNGQGQNDVVVQTMRWGLQAKWNDPNSTSFKNPINARSEVVLAGTANIWNTVRGSKHCIIICEGYYEWLKSGTKRTPHYVKRPDGHLILLAGFYELVKPTKPPSKTIYTCTILTTEPNDQLAFLHDRMPIILDGAQAMKWMEAGRKWKPEVLEELRKPYKGDLICYEVPAGVGRVGNEDPAFVEPLAERKDGLKALMDRMAQKPKQEPSSPPPKRESSPPPQEPLDSPSKRKRGPKSENETVRLSPRIVVKTEPPIKSEPEHIVLGDDSDSDIEEDTSRKQAAPKSSLTRRRQSFGSVKRMSSPVEIDLVDSGSDSEVRINTVRKKQKSDAQQPKPSSSASQKRRPGKSSRAPSRKSLTDFFGRR